MTLYLSAVWTQSGESGNTLKIKCSGTADERANIFAVPTTTEAECSSQCSVSVKMPLLLLSKPPQRRPSGAAVHDFGSLHRKKKSPGGISEAMRYGIDRASRRETRLSEPFRSRHQARLTIARRRCRNAHYLFQ